MIQVQGYGNTTGFMARGNQASSQGELHPLRREELSPARQAGWMPWDIGTHHLKGLGSKTTKASCSRGCPGIPPSYLTRSVMQYLQ